MKSCPLSLAISRSSVKGNSSPGGSNLSIGTNFLCPSSSSRYQPIQQAFRTRRYVRPPLLTSSPGSTRSWSPTRISLPSTFHPFSTLTLKDVGKGFSLPVVPMLSLLISGGVSVRRLASAAALDVGLDVGLVEAHR